MTGIRTVEVVEEDARWRDPGLEAICERAARGVLSALGRDADRHEISLLACDDARIAKLNGSFRARSTATNILSWPAYAAGIPEPQADDTEPVFLGDLAIAYETCTREAEAVGIPLADHAAHLIVHGCLHLLGYHHQAHGEASRMEALETKILATMGIANPYTDQERP